MFLCREVVDPVAAVVEPIMDNGDIRIWQYFDCFHVTGVTRLSLHRSYIEAKERYKEELEKTHDVAL